MGNLIEPYNFVSHISKASAYIPESVPYQPVLENVKRLDRYRNSTVHFYNEPSLSAIIYSLAQTCIVNYKDLVLAFFGQDITEEITLTLLPLGFGSPPDPIVFLRDRNSEPSQDRFVDEFITEIVESTRHLESNGLDTGRFLTRYSVSLQSVKKISVADIVVGINGNAEKHVGNVVIEKTVDSNSRFPFKRTDVLNRIGDRVNSVRFTAHTLNAIIYKYDCKNNSDFIFMSLGGGAMQYSSEFISFVKRLSKSDLEMVVSEYSRRPRQKSRSRRI